MNNLTIHPLRWIQSASLRRSFNSAGGETTHCAFALRKSSPIFYEGGSSSGLLKIVCVELTCKVRGSWSDIGWYFVPVSLLQQVALFSCGALDPPGVGCWLPFTMSTRGNGAPLRDSKPSLKAKISDSSLSMRSLDFSFPNSGRNCPVQATESRLRERSADG